MVVDRMCQSGPVSIPVCQGFYEQNMSPGRDRDGFDGFWLNVHRQESDIKETAVYALHIHFTNVVNIWNPVVDLARKLIVKKKNVKEPQLFYVLWSPRSFLYSS